MAIFGNTNARGDSYLSAEDSLTAGYFQMGSLGGTADSITAHIYVAADDDDWSAGIYDSNNNLVTNGQADTVNITTNWQAKEQTWTFSAPKPTLVANAWYYLVVWTDETSGTHGLYREASGGDGGHIDTSVDYDALGGTLPATIDIDSVTPSVNPNIWCTYTESAREGFEKFLKSNSYGIEKYVSSSRYVMNKYLSTGGY